MARRGENIHKRKDGRWEGRYIKARTPDRRICWGYVYGTTYAEVKQRLIHKKSEYGGFQLIDAHLTFTELAEAWLQSVKCGLKESTCAHYQYTLYKYVLPILGTVPISRLEENILEQALQKIIAPPDRPKNFRGRPFGVGDVIVINQQGEITAYFVDKDSLVVVAGFIRSSSSGILVTLDTKNLFIDGCAGTWMATEECVVESQHFFLMQHEVYKEKAPNVIVDASGKLVSTEIRKGLDEDARKKILDYLHANSSLRQHMNYITFIAMSKMLTKVI